MTGVGDRVPVERINEGHSDDHELPSAVVHACVPEADGFLFVSRFTGDACVAVFDRAFGKLRVLGVDELVRHAGFVDALDDYDIVLTEPPG